MMMPAIVKPEIRKNTSTPMKPPGMASGKAWKFRTSITALARRPSTSGRYFDEGNDTRGPTRNGDRLRQRGKITARGSLAGPRRTAISRRDDLQKSDPQGYRINPRIALFEAVGIGLWTP